MMRIKLIELHASLSLRKSKEAKKTWTPPSSLDAPPAPKGMHIDG